MNNKFNENNMEMGSKKSKTSESMLQTTNSFTTNDEQPTTNSSLFGSNPGGAIIEK